MKKSEISKSFYHKLTCKVYILGASSEGESVLFIVYGDDKIIYSCITDSFIVDKVNIPEKILEECHLHQITDVFWTHPHDDHSAGLIDLIEKYKPEYVYIPSELQSLPDTFSVIPQNVLNKINMYPSFDNRYSYQPRIEGIGANYCVLDKILSVNGVKIPFSIYTIAPAVGRTRRDVITQNYGAINDFSIAVSIIIGDFSILLTGDIQDRMIQYVASDLQRDIPTPNLMKIPHHGSKESLTIMSLFDTLPTIDVAVTTAKKSSKLPKIEALDFYDPLCDRIYKIKDDIQGVAIWGADIDIINATMNEIELQNYCVYQRT